MVMVGCVCVCVKESGCPLNGFYPDLDGKPSKEF